MLTTKYLYGISPEEFANLKYKEALEVKLKSAKELFGVLCGQEEDLYRNGAKYSMEKVSVLRLRLKRVAKAIKHTEMLIEEIKDA